MIKTSEDCESLISPGLIRHLCNSAANCGDGGCFFILTPRRFGSALVQDILVLSENSCSHQTVLGYRPVDLTVGVTCGSEPEMYLVSPEKPQCESAAQKNTGHAFLPHRRPAEKSGALCLGRAR